MREHIERIDREKLQTEDPAIMSQSKQALNPEQALTVPTGGNEMYKKKGDGSEAPQKKARPGSAKKRAGSAKRKSDG